MTMTCYERIEAAWNLEEADRVPVAPLVIYLIPYQAGLSFKDMLAEPEMVGQAAIDQQDLIGDGIHPVATFFDHQFLLPNAGWDQVTLNWKIFERFPPDGNIPNAYFDKVIIDDYEEILEHGFAQLMFNRQIDSNVLRMGVDEWLYRAFEYPPRFAQAWRRFTAETGKSLLFGARTTIPFEYPIYYRGFPLLIEDLLEQPEQVKAYCEAVVEYETFIGMHKAMIMGAGQVPGADAFFFQAGYPGPPYFSPAVFEEFIYPTMKQCVDEAVQRGFRMHIHLSASMATFQPPCSALGPRMRSMPTASSSSRTVPRAGALSWAASVRSPGMPSRRTSGPSWPPPKNTDSMDPGRIWPRTTRNSFWQRSGDGSDRQRPKNSTTRSPAGFLAGTRTR
jgi:hypothetical protein